MKQNKLRKPNGTYRCYVPGGGKLYMH